MVMDRTGRTGEGSGLLRGRGGRRRREGTDWEMGLGRTNIGLRRCTRRMARRNGVWVQVQESGFSFRRRRKYSQVHRQGNGRWKWLPGSCFSVCWSCWLLPRWDSSVPRLVPGCLTVASRISLVAPEDVDSRQRKGQSLGRSIVCGPGSVGRSSMSRMTGLPSHRGTHGKWHLMWRENWWKVVAYTYRGTM